MKEIRRDIDGNLIDLEKDDLYEKLTFESANLIRRFSSLLIDTLLIITIWYLLTLPLFKEVDGFIEVLGKNPADFENEALYLTFRDMVWTLFLKSFLYYLGAKLAYNTLVPAIIGNGQTIGKFLTGIGVVDYISLNELSPTRLFLREFVFKILLNLLIVPYVISVFMAFRNEDSRALHDVLSKSVVIKLDLYNLE